MTWLLVTLASYFLSAVAAILDKYLLSGRIGSPAMYAFLMALFSSFAFLAIPFGVEWQGLGNTSLAVFSGILFLYGLVAFYDAVKKSEVSRVAPGVGVIMALTSFLVVFLKSSSDIELVANEAHLLLAFFLLVGGALLVSFDLPLKKTDTMPISSVFAGVLFAVSLLYLKEAYAGMNFVNGFFWSRFGIFLGGFTLLLIPVFRRDIFSYSAHFTEPHPHHAMTGLLFVLNKTCGGLAAFLLVYAVSIGPLTMINALSGVQFAFVFLLSFLLSFFYPAIYGEKLAPNDWVQKAFAIAMIGVGISLLASATSGAGMVFF